MIDPELQYCLRCQDEYRADIEICGVCGMLLISGADVLKMEAERRQQLESRGGELSADDEVVSIRRGPLADLRHLEGLLKRENIGSLIAGDESSCGKGCCPATFFLQVRADVAGEALAILEKDFQKSTALAHHDASFVNAVYDAGAQETVCPACGHIFSTSLKDCPDCGLCLG